MVTQKKVNFAIKTEDSLPMTSRKPTADISNVKIEDTDIFHEGLNETPLSPKRICISSENSQKDTVSADEDTIPYNGKYFYFFYILSSFQMLYFLINSLNLS